jgi:hypothetical protein
MVSRLGHLRLQLLALVNLQGLAEKKVGIALGRTDLLSAPNLATGP